MYSHITIEDVEERYLSLYNSSERKDLRPRKICPRCGLPINDNFNFCPRCGQPLSSKASLEKLLEAHREESEVEEAKMLLDKLLDLVMRNPELVRNLLSGDLRQGKA